MKKKVNGKTVEIDNIEVFEKAAEGIAINRTATSNINDNEIFDSEEVKNTVQLYNDFYSSLPYPLYAIDTDVKYAALGSFMKSKKCNLSMWINNGLYVCLDKDKGIAIHFVNSTWGIVKITEIEKDNTDISNYCGQCGYRDLDWALNRILAGKNVSTYYKEFMPEFIDACNCQPMVLKWELGSILDFGKIPEKIILPDNKIINLEDSTEYTLDLFVTGTRASKEKQHVWNLTNNDEDEYIRPKYVKTYGFDVYEKNTEGNEKDSDKLTLSKLYGAHSLFCTLNLLRGIEERSTFDNYKAFISEGNMVYEINKRIFICKAYKFIEPKEVAKGVEIYSFDRGIVYLAKTVNVSRGIKKETIYSYSLRDGNIRLCKIRFLNV